MPISPRAKKQWRRIMMRRAAPLERLDRGPTPKDGDFFYVGDNNVELLAFKVRGRQDFFVPLNNQIWVAFRSDAILVVFRSIQSRVEEADAHNTSLFTCRHCGHWLKLSDDGYGTEHGWCGCLEV